MEKPRILVSNPKWPRLSNCPRQSMRRPKRYSHQIIITIFPTYILQKMSHKRLSVHAFRICYRRRPIRKVVKSIKKSRTETPLTFWSFSNESVIRTNHANQPNTLTLAEAGVHLDWRVLINDPTRHSLTSIVQRCNFNCHCPSFPSFLWPYCQSKNHPTNKSSLSHLAYTQTKILYRHDRTSSVSYKMNQDPCYSVKAINQSTSNYATPDAFASSSERSLILIVLKNNYFTYYCGVYVYERIELNSFISISMQ